MRAEKFVASASGTGLDKPALTITVKFDDSKKEEKVTFGQSGQDVYAARLANLAPPRPTAPTSTNR